MQFYINLFVSFDVSSDFGKPKITIAFMVIFSNLPISAMPKLTIAKYCNFMTFDYKIRFAKYGCVIFSVSHSGIPKKFSE